MFVATAGEGVATLRPPGPGSTLVEATRTRPAARPAPRAVGGTFPERGGGVRRPHSPGHPGLQPLEGCRELEAGGGFLRTGLGFETLTLGGFTLGFYGDRAESEVPSELQSGMPPVHSLFRHQTNPLK